METDESPTHTLPLTRPAQMDRLMKAQAILKQPRLSKEDKAYARQLIQQVYLVIEEDWHAESDYESLHRQAMRTYRENEQESKTNDQQ